MYVKLGQPCFLVQTWLILIDNTASFDEKCQELAEFQRTWLDLKGMLNYRCWKEDSKLSRIEATLNVQDCVSCITESLAITMTLQHEDPCLAHL